MGICAALQRQLKSELSDLGQIELIFTFLVSVFFFRARVSQSEVIGAILLSGAIVLLVLEKAV
ncbi:MAG: hypothetical protein CL569_20745 [Alphaproteobacteria bacterium]|nr:hypothetical protein [Alphaproteobacteria bacterium]